MKRCVILLCTFVLTGFFLGGMRLSAQAPSEEGVLFTIWEKDSANIGKTEPAKGMRPRIGLVLSGGGAKGIAHVGVLKVIEELGIPIDFVGGTSMGSIIGGLYAYGYTARELDSILRTTDWSVLLRDVPDWADVFYEDKKNYMVSLPFSLKGEVSFVPAGFLKGQHISNLFYTLTSQAYKYRTFQDFNIPFFCTVADITHGKAVYIDSGNLAVAMRASMAVPGVFAPVQLDSMTLVDGGIQNNFPVDIMKQRGADIVIGVDVGFAYKAEPADNFLEVLEQVVFMGSKNRVVENRNRCDVLVRPDMTGLSATSFSKTDTLLARGETAARERETYARLKALAESLDHYRPDPPKEKKPYLPLDRVFVSEIRYEGLNKYNKTYIDQFLQVETDKWTSLDDISDGVNRLYGSNVFKSVRYEFIQDAHNPDATILVVKVEESPSNIFSAGVRFDNERSAALLAGVEFRNLGFKNSTLMADVELSKMASVRIDYMVRPGWKSRKKGYKMWMPSAGLTLEYYRVSCDLYRDPENFKERTSKVNSNRYKVRLYAQSNWKLNVLGVGFAYEYAQNNQYLYNTVIRKDIFNNSYVYPYLYFKRDSYNKKFYPTKGSRMNVEVNLPINVERKSEIERKDAARSFLSAYWSADFAIGFGKKKIFCLYPGFTVGAVFFNHGEVPIQFQFFQGGCSDIPGWFNSSLPGVNLGQSSGYGIANIRLTAQITLIKNLYLSLRGGVGRAEYTFKDWINPDLLVNRLIYGGNIGLSYNTPVGPVGISFQTSNVNAFNVYLNIGYWF